MSNTQRTIQNFPTSLDSLSNLVELDLSRNSLQKVPQCLYNMPNLRRLNLSGNDIGELSSEVEFWKKLEVLNLSRNKLTALPQMLCKCSQLRFLYLNDNLLDFDGIPAGIGKLCSLEIFSASNNHLEMIPEGLCRCGALKKLNLSSNRLITLPDAIHLLSDLDQLDLRNNPNLIMPPKPIEMQKGSGIEFYNIDFSLQHQLTVAGASVPPAIAASTANTQKDSIARKIRLRRGVRTDSTDKDSAKVLKGMKDLAKDKELQQLEDEKVESLRPKRWDETLEKPPLDYSEIFEEDDGQIPGLTIWEIENFLPNKIDQVIHGKFYEGDCYIVLKTYTDENSQLTWQIYFWIGAQATLDKRACAAIHAVNLRNYLGARCRTIREEQGDESEEFFALFDTPITYIEGGRTSTGFYTVEDVMLNTRMYRVHGSGASIHLEPVQVDASALDPRFVFVIDTGEQIFMWYGKKSKNTLKSKARLMVEKINKNERKSKLEILMETQGDESEEFRRVFGVTEVELVEHVDVEWQPVAPRLYQVQLGMGYLELPQVEMPQDKLVHTLLNSKNVYILDCITDVFVWFGKKSARLVRAAAVKLSQELFNMIARPEYAMITRVQEGTETQIFKSKFVGWEEIIAVDFTRTAASVAKTGADLTKWARQQETRADLAALFMPRQPVMTVAEATQLEEDWNYDLEAMECLVLEDKKFVRLPEDEFGIFYTGECYVFFCRYFMPPDEEDAAEQPGTSVAPTASASHAAPDDEIQCVVYFWQGREAGNMGWLTFTFTLQKKFKAMFGDDLEVVRIHQQQENLKFMAHFKRKFTIKSGRRKPPVPDPSEPPSNRVELYHLRSNGSALCTRLIQIKPDATQLNSAFCYILYVPFDSSDNENSGIVYVWIGAESNPEEAKLIQEIAEDMFNNPWVSLQVREPPSQYPASEMG